MTNQEFERIRAHIKKGYGIDLEGKKEIVRGRMEFYIHNLGYATYNEYMDAVSKDITGKMEKEMVNILTTNHTFFMRESEHFEFMKKEVLPWIKELEENTKDMRIWCGACSTGEEPYALAMVIRDFLGLDQNRWDTQILATDISTEVLAQAVEGIYSDERIAVIPDNWKRRYFRKLPDGKRYRITDELKKGVLFRQLNLMNPFPFKRKMHVVFLRNVMIYFDDNTKKQLIQKIYDVLEPGGYLFVGRTETIDRSSVPFKLVQPSIFRK